MRTLKASIVGVAFGAACSSSTNAPIPIACTQITPDATCFTMVFGGVTRTYLLHVPANFHANTSALVVALHGSNGSGLRLMNTSGLNATADKAGFAVAYPFALVSPGAGITEWNEYFNHSFGTSAPDDAGFLRQLIVTLQAQLAFDPKRVYVTGLSNGGFMAHRAAIDLSDIVAAIGVVEGTVVSPGTVSSLPNPAHPVSVLMLHGDQDPTVPCCTAPPVASQEESFNYWSGPRANSCTAFNTTQPICDAQLQQTAIPEKDASGCLGNTEVKFYRLQGGVHLWYTVPMNVPGQAPYNPALNATTGVTTNDILWNFFASHPKA